MKRKTLRSWSSGKDSAWALYKLQAEPAIEVVGLFCTVNSEFKRVARHGVKIELLQQQARSIGLPLEIIEIPYPCSNDTYEEIMTQFVAKAKQANIEHFAFGDLFLEDIRHYREAKLKDTGITPLFPIWNTPTDKLAKQMFASGLRALITCVAPKQLPIEIVSFIIEAISRNAQIILFPFFSISMFFASHAGTWKP
jgi:diphthamide synthase (EF-2-diphthine--ammonia ligase)